MSNQVAVFDAKKSKWLRVHKGLGVDLMEHLFSRLESKYPRIWRQSFDNAKQIENWKFDWAETFEREGLTPDDLRVGLQNVTRQYPDYPPTEGQFLLCCRPARDYEATFKEAQEQYRLREEGKDEWSNPAVFWAAVEIGSFDLRNASYSQIKGRWTRELDKAFASRSHIPVPPLMVALPAPGRNVASPEETKKRCEELKARLQAIQLAKGKQVKTDLANAAIEGIGKLADAAIAAARQVVGEADSAPDFPEWNSAPMSWEGPHAA